MGRLILLVLVLGVGFWLYKHSAGGLLGSRSTGNESASAPLDRARAAARKADERQAEADRIGREDSSTGAAGQIHENMTPSQVRALLGPPDEITSGSSDSGVPRETWLYRSVGKKVV
ncbi:MAG TPA: hypothetical protein VGK70_02410, partial [Thermoanaerobaculia bacterium]